MGMSRTKNLGILYILCAAFCFSLMNLFVRLAGNLPVMQKCFFRNLVALLWSGTMLLRSEEKFHIRPGCLPSLVLRSVAGLLGVICNFYAVGRLNISDASMLNKLSPFFAMIFSGWILKERSSRRDWALVALAFGGAVLVVKPTAGLASFPALIGVAGGLLAGLAYTYVRRLGKLGERSAMVVFFFAAVSCAATLPSLIVNFSQASSRQLFSLLLASCAATGGQFSINAAYTRAPAREISVFDYTQVVFSALLGYLFLSQVPDTMSLVGYVWIISVAVYKWSYDHHRA